MPEPSSGAATRDRQPPRDKRSEPNSKPTPALSEPSVWVDLPLPNGHPALVALPLGATGPRPVLVAAHGAGDIPEWYCAVWQRLVAGRGFVVCPRGYPIYPHVRGTSGYFYDGHPSLGREIGAALSALQQHYGPYVDLERPLFVGYSQGANMGALVLPEHPARFASAALLEGGVGEFQEWNVRNARHFRERGAGRVLMVCGRAKCAEFARTTAHYMRMGGLEVRVDHARGEGHTYRGRVSGAVAESFAWLVEGDDRW